MNRRQKASIIGILSLGMFATAAAIVKLSYVSTYGRSGDWLWDSSLCSAPSSAPHMVADLARPTHQNTSHGHMVPARARTRRATQSSTRTELRIVDMADTEAKTHICSLPSARQRRLNTVVLPDSHPVGVRQSLAKQAQRVSLGCKTKAGSVAWEASPSLQR
jgi:hypothetical protein